MKGFRGVIALTAAMTLAGSASAWADATCLTNARADFRSCLTQCRSDFVDSRLTCRNVQPACGEACLAGRQTCLDNVQNILETGVLPDGSPLANCTGGTDECKAALQAARKACGAPCQPTDAACTGCVDNAQVVAFECRDTCRDSWRTNATVIAMQQSCQSSFKACIQKCPPANATTTTTVP
jgi:hypothetical protein